MIEIIQSFCCPGCSKMVAQRAVALHAQSAGGMIEVRFPHKMKCDCGWTPRSRYFREHENAAVNWWQAAQISCKICKRFSPIDLESDRVDLCNYGKNIRLLIPADLECQLCANKVL